MNEREELLEEALERIAEWAEAYPTDIFEPPTPGQSQQAHEKLKTIGMSLDKFSAHAMRHALKGVGEIARGVLERASKL